MGWSLAEDRKLRHTNGSNITLLSGTWQAPGEINPILPESISAVEQVHLIRQGIHFAREIQQNHSPRR